MPLSFMKYIVVDAKGYLSRWISEDRTPALTLSTLVVTIADVFELFVRLSCSSWGRCHELLPSEFPPPWCFYVSPPHARSR